MMKKFVTFNTPASKLFYLAVFFVMASCFVYLFHILQGRWFDWVYFDSMANFIRSSIIHYKTLPFHDPWVCSGNSLLSNPQNWLFSPLILLTVLFPPTLGNLISILFLKVIGFFGCMKYFSQHGISKNLCYLGSALYVNSSWFALHFAEGHVVFRTFLLLPLVFYFIETPFTRKRLFVLFLLLLFLLFDGGIYPLIFSLIYSLIFYLFNPRKAFLGLKFLKKHFSFVFFIFLGLFFISLLKVVPVLLNVSNMKQEQERIVLSTFQMIQVFFHPFLKNSHVFYDTLRFHEFGLYLGFSLTLAFLFIILRNPGFNPRDKKIFAFIVLFFWIGTGIGNDFNPYSIISSIPFINIAHVQTRYLIIFFLLFLILILRIASRINKLPKFFFALLIISNIEFLVVNFNSFEHLHNYRLPLITKTSWHETVEYIPKIYAYFIEGKVSRQCYEPSVQNLYSLSRPMGTFSKQIFLIEGDFKFDPIHLVPGTITVDYQSQKGAKVVFNTHHLDEWIEILNDFPTFNSNGLLGVEVSQGTGRIVLSYWPYYLESLFILAILGILILFYAYKRIFRV
jgi:uncharacterized membrane protein YfhO